MRNFIQPGNTLTLPAPYNAIAGAGILIGSIFGVANSNAVIGNNADVTTEGVFSLSKAGVAITLGGKVYWDDTAKLVTNVSAGNTLIGVAVEAAAALALTATVRLNGSF